MDDKQQARELYAIQQDRNYQNELWNLLKDMPTLNDMMTKEYRQELEEKQYQEAKERDKIQFEKDLKEQMNKKNPKKFGVGSKFTKPKMKRK